MAPHCITMLLTPDHGERAKGKPEAPKAQTPHYCTGPKPCQQFTHSTQRVQDSPSVNKKTTALRVPDTCPTPQGTGGHVARPLPRDSEVPRPAGSGPPTIRILKPIRHHILRSAGRIDGFRCRATSDRFFDPISNLRQISNINTQPHAKRELDRSYLSIGKIDRSEKSTDFRVDCRFFDFSIFFNFFFAVFAYDPLADFCAVFLQTPDFAIDL